MVLTHDIETSKGQDQCHRLADLEKRLGFRSSFGFVPERYAVLSRLRDHLEKNGFEVAVHGLFHDGKYYKSRTIFKKRALRINQYLKEWGSIGFRSPSMQHNLDWIHDLNIEYDSSTFDTDPFEPQPEGAGTIFPFWVTGPANNRKGYLELPYTLPQDHTLFVILQEKTNEIWKRKLDWIAEKGGMALLITHPDYMHFGKGGNGRKQSEEEYPVQYYEEFLKYLKSRYEGQYWHVLPKDLVRFWAENYRNEGPRHEAVPAASVTLKKDGKIWIDLDNSPHVPFFSPIIHELEKKGYQVVLTARDQAQTCGLADLFGMDYRRIGRHYGKNKIAKVAGTLYRGLQLREAVKNDKPVLAVSHGSRAQMLAAYLMGVPSITIMDYEHVKGFIKPTWVMMPEVISDSAVKFDSDHILKYPGIKEDVYVPSFKPDPEIKDELSLQDTDITVVIRPPATEAHYHNPEAEGLFSAVVNRLGPMENVHMVIVPRNESQQEWIEGLWPEWCQSGKILIPKQVVDGLNLLWHADLVISGGGTMNREAAALGVPVYSIFRGKIGDVDRFLSQNGRLTMLESVDDVGTKLKISKRQKPKELAARNNETLRAVVAQIVRALETKT